MYKSVNCNNLLALAKKCHYYFDFFDVFMFFGHFGALSAVLPEILWTKKCLANWGLVSMGIIQSFSSFHVAN